MDSETAEGYRPHVEFIEGSKEALVDLNLTNSTELWLLKLPFSNDLLSDIDGQQLSLNLHNDGELANFEGLNGKVYDFVSYAAEEPDETVFISSATEPKIAQSWRFMEFWELVAGMMILKAWVRFGCSWNEFGAFGRVRSKLGVFTLRLLRRNRLFNIVAEEEEVE